MLCDVHVHVCSAGFTLPRMTGLSLCPVTMRKYALFVAENKADDGGFCVVVCIVEREREWRIDYWRQMVLNAEVRHLKPRATKTVLVSSFVAITVIQFAIARGPRGQWAKPKWLVG
jgi:hypothetical protein